MKRITAELTFDGNRTWLHFVKEKRMAIFLFQVAKDAHARGKKCYVPCENEAHCQATVYAKDLNGWK